MMATVIVVLSIIFLVVASYHAHGEGRTYKSDSIDNRMTTCRLAIKKTFDKTKYCIYRGANGTYEQHSVPSYEVCAKQFSCKYRPREAGKETTQDIIEKLERNFQ